MLDAAQKRTRGRLLGEPNHEIWAEEIVQNLPVVSLVLLGAALPYWPTSCGANTDHSPKPCVLCLWKASCHALVGSSFK